MHREGQGATAPALLGGAEEPLLDGHLACDLPGLAGGDSLAVACAMRGCGHSFEECSGKLLVLHHSRLLLKGTSTTEGIEDAGGGGERVTAARAMVVVW